jgi:hypothetical protein
MPKNKENTLMSTIPAAPISYAIAIIPGEPLYSQVAEASLAIAERCENRNIIDNKKFPCHLSLLLSGSTKKGLDMLADRLAGMHIASKRLKALTLQVDQRGFITVAVDNAPLMELQQNILPMVEEVLGREPVIRPRLIERWHDIPGNRQELIRRFGSYKVGLDFDPHLSVADVAPALADEMIILAREIITVPTEVPLKALQIVDIGHKNEKWDILSTIQLM